LSVRKVLAVNRSCHIIIFIMNTPWMASEPQPLLRQLAVSMVLDGEPPEEVADTLHVGERSVWRWLAAWRADGSAGLISRPRSGRPPKLSDAQAQQVLAWIHDGRSATEFGFVTERWTAPRVAELIRRCFGVRMNARYLNDWLRRRGQITPQVPQRQPRERDQRVIDAWVAHDWPRIKKRRWS
jgi:transposase